MANKTRYRAGSAVDAGVQAASTSSRRDDRQSKGKGKGNFLQAVHERNRDEDTGVQHVDAEPEFRPGADSSVGSSSLLPKPPESLGPISTKYLAT